MSAGFFLLRLQSCMYYVYVCTYVYNLKICLPKIFELNIVHLEIVCAHCSAERFTASITCSCVFAGSWWVKYKYRPYALA